MISEAKPEFTKGQEVDVVDWRGIKFDGGRIISAKGDLKALFGDTLYRVWRYEVRSDRGIILDLPERVLRRKADHSPSTLAEALARQEEDMSADIQWLAARRAIGSHDPDTADSPGENHG